jgi:hypothetical protein
MSTAVPPIPSEAVPEKLSEPQRIVDTFIAPSKTFEDIRHNASWWLPWALIGILSLFVVSAVSKKINFEQLVRQQIENSSRAEQFASLPKDQQERQIALAAKIGRVAAYLSPILTLISGLVTAVVLMFAFNFGFEAEVPFSRALAIVFYSWLPELIRAVFILITALARSDFEGLNPKNMVATNPGYFMDPNGTSKFLYGMATSLDVITIWSIVLLGLGFAINSRMGKLKPGTAIATIFAIYLIYKAAFSALGWV